MKTYSILMIIIGAVLCLSHVTPDRYFRAGVWGRSNPERENEFNYMLAQAFKESKVKVRYAHSTLIIGIAFILAGILMWFI